MVRLERNGPVATIVLDRPEKLNAMTTEFWGEMRATLKDIADDEDIRAAIVRGEGKCFSVGGDIAGFGDLQDADSRRAYAAEAIGALLAVEACPKPVIAAVHG